MTNSRERFTTIAAVDTNGLLRGQKVAAHELPGILASGMGMSPVQLALDPTDVIMDMPGITDDLADFHDSMLEVDQHSRRTIPWEAEGDNNLYLAQFTGEAADFCPRSLLRKVLTRAQSMGIVPKIGYEQEYTLFNETPQSLIEKGFDNLNTATVHPSHDLLIYQVNQSKFYKEVADFCDVLGIKLAKMHEEISGGFMEACISADNALEVADQSVLLKNFLRIHAMRQGQTISYMPRWSEDADSQSSHLHISLLDQDGKPLFWDESDENNMSDTFRYFLGGLQTFMPDFMLIFAPTVNSWRRFAPGTFAPPAYTWGIENRTTCLRVVGTSPKSIRVENRLPCSDSNPYLAAAATIAAGLAGIEGKISPSAQTQGNGYIPQSFNGQTLLPGMKAAIEAMRQSGCVKDWLSPRFVETFTATRSAQVRQFKGKSLIDERRRFFELG
ncbi:glutamine synthetase family protein [Vibrio sp. MEBiC08052]|uniref:glutamine synthetase family protein n=1 Tax=Vibrio sp. MEBiC08052 TaxID=1761910 RepID=UPI0007407BB5|nr:glutamine synthetase family protein [Vibrio sp. MEBiC08052]KUI98600.1 Glutamine synthetase [Vibrio sp. MEBiC08052]